MRRAIAAALALLLMLTAAELEAGWFGAEAPVTETVNTVAPDPGVLYLDDNWTVLYSSGAALTTTAFLKVGDRNTTNIGTADVAPDGFPLPYAMTLTEMVFNAGGSTAGGGACTLFVYASNAVPETTTVLTYVLSGLPGTVALDTTITVPGGADMALAAKISVVSPATVDAPNVWLRLVRNR